MKKFFFFAATAVALTVACQKNEVADDVNPVAIQFNTNVATVVTKGAGQIEDLTEASALYVYCLNTTRPTQQTQKNVEATVNANKEVVFAGGATYFYAGTYDKYEFYGYYVDDAATGTPDADTYKLDVTIDGTQDILYATTDPRKDIEGNAVVTDAKLDRVYSAWSARNGVKPQLVFDHALTQFKFKVQNSGSQKLTLKAIQVTSPKEGVFTVAGAEQGLVVKAGAEAKALNLVSTTLTNGLELDGHSAVTSVDGEIMVYAGQENKVMLTLWQIGRAHV